MAAERIKAAITETLKGENQIKAILDAYNPTGTTAFVNFTTSKALRWQTRPDKSHVNWVVCDSDWEAEFARVAESHPRVMSYVKNQGLGLEVPYLHGSTPRKYIPDFIVQIDDGSVTSEGMPDPLNAQNAYSIAKRCAEHLCALYAQQHGLQTVVARCFAFVGRDLPLDVHFAIGNFIRDALARPRITVNGDGTPVRSYMDQRDLARWLEALLRRGRAGQAYNVGSDAALTIAELAHQVRDLLAPGKPVHIAAQDTGGPRSRYVPCIAKAHAELGLDLRHTLRDAVLETARHAEAVR